MSFSLALMGSGFMVSCIGAVMVWLSFRTRPRLMSNRGEKPKRLNDAEGLVRVTLLLGLAVTAVLYIASFLGMLAW